MTDIRNTIDPKLDLILERIVDVPVELIWKAWTEPEHLKVWFCPKPWMVTECEMDVRPGGLFRTVMRGPDGEEHAGSGCYLELVENERLVWTDTMEKDYRPTLKGNDCIEGHFTAFVMMEPYAEGSKYTVVVKHSDEETRKRHEERGFEEGWGTALDQLVEYVKTL